MIIRKNVHEISTPLNLTSIKLGVIGVYLFFLFLLKNIDCGYSLEPPRVLSQNIKKKKSIFFSNEI